MKKILVCFAAGCLGALVYSLVAWQAGALGITRWAGVLMAPSLSAGSLYPKIVQGGLWGLLFVLPFLKSKPFLKGTLLSLLPTAFQLLYLFPHKAGCGLFGVGLGMWTPAFILAYNWIWGLVTAMTIRFSK